MNPKERKALKQLLEEAGIDQPSNQFTDRVMDRIEALPAIQERTSAPISVRGWIAIAAAAVVILALGLFRNVGDSTPSWMPNFDSLAVELPAFDNYLLGGVAAAAIWLLIVADRLIRKRLMREA